MARTKGAIGKLNKDMKDILHLAFERAGGVDYLVRQADAEPKAFMALIGRLVPAAVTVDVGMNLVSLFDAMESAKARLEPSTQELPLIDVTPNSPELTKPLITKDKG